MATGGYAPPEQQAGKQVDATVDLFALGITLAECLGPKAGEGIWREIIGQLTHFLPSVRGTAEELINRLSGAKVYYVGVPGEQPEGPLSEDNVVDRVLSGARELQVWWEGQSEWSNWDQIPEIKSKVESNRYPTPPPMPKAVIPPPIPQLQVVSRDRAAEERRKDEER
jgi:hypothetical protein